MAVDYATLKKGGFMRQKQKNNFQNCNLFRSWFVLLVKGP